MKQRTYVTFDICGREVGAQEAAVPVRRWIGERIVAVDAVSHADWAVA